MRDKVVILGAKGRFGRAAVHAFHSAGWRVRAFARSWPDDTGLAPVERTTGNAFDANALSRAAQGCDVIVNALNPPYPRWKRDLPVLTASVIGAAKSSGATVMVPGNVYVYGQGMPERLLEDTPHRPTSRKGQLRVDMMQAYVAAADSGVRTVILRAGDFVERQKTGNWFDSHIAANVGKGNAMYPGPLDRVHAWAYLPDVARAMVGLAAKRQTFAAVEQFGFSGFSLTGQELIEALERACGRTLKIRSMPWSLIKLLGLFMPQMREMLEMAYLWSTPHALDGGKLASVLPDFQPTPLATAMTQALGKIPASEAMNSEILHQTS